MFKKAQKPVNKAAIYSAAIQDHLIKKSNLNLDLGFGFKIPKYKPIKSQTPQLPQLEQPRGKSLKPKATSTSILPYQSEDMKRLRNQYDETMRNNQYKKKLTLAQRLGIITAPPPPLSAAEWEKIESMSKNRKDSENMCSICLEDFKLNPQTILSCSHVFHLNCLSSFEKHNKIRACPICRRQDYEKKIIDEGIRIFTMKCILRIQKCIRGSQLRKVLYESLILKSFKAESKLFSRRIISYKMQKLSIKMHLEAKKKEQVYKKLFNAVEQQTKAMHEELFDKIVEYQKYKIKNKQQLDEYLGNDKQQKQQKQKQVLAENKMWDQARTIALKRNETTCSICLMSLVKKPTYLLSCSHTFHANCINSFERYSFPNNLCPCCRGQYKKALFQIQ